MLSKQLYNIWLNEFLNQTPALDFKEESNRTSTFPNPDFYPNLKKISN